MKRQFIIIASYLLFIMPIGCSTPRIHDYQPASPSTTERTAEVSGVEVALDPFVESARTKKYFDVDAIGDGIAILHVRVTNKTPDQTFLVEKKDFQLIPETSAGNVTGDGKKIERSRAAGTALEISAVATVALAPIGGSILLLSGIAADSKSTEVQRNFTSKEMGDATLPPGQSMEGFIYFTPVAKGKDWSRTAAVMINLTETKTRQMITLNIPLPH